MSIKPSALPELTPLPVEPVEQPPAAEGEPFFAVDATDGVPPTLEVIERAYVARVLDHTAGRRLAAAHLLGISYPTFLKRLREIGIDQGTQRRPLRTA